MTKENFYKIEFYTCPAHIPFHFAVHPWVVITKNNQSDRYEIIHKKYDEKERFGFVYKNFYKNPQQGIKKSLRNMEYWTSKKIAEIDGDENSLAHRMYDFIHDVSPYYPHKATCKIFPGPNSNTYINWILKKFPEANIKLPWNAFGKNF